MRKRVVKNEFSEVKGGRIRLSLVSHLRTLAFTQVPQSDMK